jgi:hypothetical protein
MFQWVTIILAVLGSLGGFIYVKQSVMSAIRRSNRSRFFLGKTSAKYLAIGSTPDGGSVRKADKLALAAISNAFGSKRFPATCRTANASTSASLHTDPLLVLGSPRFNSVADDLQKRIEFPFQFVSLTPELSSDKSVLGIHEDAGNTYVCSSDPSLGEVERNQRPRSLSGKEEDYGLLAVGELTDSGASGQRLIWAAGIHGIGTLGVAKWAVQHFNDYDWEKLGNVCFLIRIRFELPKGQAFVRGSENETMDNADPQLITGPCKWTPRRSLTESPVNVGILCDLGSVLLPFQRRRFEHNLQHLLGIEPLTEQQRRQIDKLQARFEEGLDDSATFLTNLSQCLGRSQSDNATIQHAWNDIFWRNEAEIWLLGRLRERRLATLVLISNTDPLRLEHALGRLKLSQLFDRDHIVASFDPDVTPKGVDTSMVRKGLAILQKEYQQRRFVAVFIDDVREYLINAQEAALGVQQIHFRSFPQVVCDLRKFGLYEPMTETIPS